MIGLYNYTLYTLIFSRKAIRDKTTIKFTMNPMVHPHTFVNQSIICAVFDPKVGFHGPPNVSLLSLSLELFIIFFLRSISLCHPATSCVVFPLLVFLQFLPSKTLVISLPLDPLRMCPANSNFLLLPFPEAYYLT